MTGTMISYSEAKNIEETVRYFYVLENEQWHKSVHQKGGSVEENVKYTVGVVSPESVMYEVIYGPELAGFFVKYENESGKAMEGFHIKKEFRKGWFIKEFWGIVKKEFGSTFYVGLCSINTSGIDHVIRQGFKKVKDVVENDKLFVVLECKQ